MTPVNMEGCKMKVTRIQPNCLLMLILSFHIMFIQSEASHNEDLRVLIVGFRGHTRFRAANILLGRTDRNQKERETVRSEVITDEGRRMMVVTGPNLCERDTERQALKRALILSSPGPHAVLMTLNLRDEEYKECDFTKQIQELLGTEVLQYCVVVLNQNDPEKTNNIVLRGKVGKMINTCRGRFHIITDSHPKPAQTSALIREIDKLVWINEGRFYSSLNENTEQIKTERLELLKRLQEIESLLYIEEDSQDVKKENLVTATLVHISGGEAGIIGWIVLILLNAGYAVADVKHEWVISGARLGLVVMFMVTLRNVFSPDVAIAINLARSITFAAVVMQKHKSNINKKNKREENIPDTVLSIVSLGLILGSFISVRSWSDVLIACYAAPGVTVGAVLCLGAFFKLNQMDNTAVTVFGLKVFLSCIVGLILSKVCLTVFALIGLQMTAVLLISLFSTSCFYCKMRDIRGFVMVLVVFLIIPCVCVFIGSIIVILKMTVNFVTLHQFYVTYLLGIIGNN